MSRCKSNQVPLLEERIIESIEKRPGITKEVLHNSVISKVSPEIYQTIDLQQYNKALENIQDKVEIQLTPFQNYFHKLNKLGIIYKFGFYKRE